MTELLILTLISCLKPLQPTFAIISSTWESTVTRRLWLLAIVPTPFILSAYAP